MKRPYFIGIAGGSCAGKTTLAIELAKRLGAERTVRISVDSYYQGPPSAAPEIIDQYNFDDPSALDHQLLTEHLRRLSQGLTADVPVYDFRTHRRTGEIIPVGPASFVILEGLFPLYWDDVREFLDTKVFIDVPHKTCLARRIYRDTRERGRPREEVIRRYNDMARPMFESYVFPTRRLADVTVDGERPVGDFVTVVMKHIEENAGLDG
ncbi:MAG: uridine kinase [Candidatus Latescibacterota bacterium]|nr:MAG: uridine kinase [Candidatus Latescibacterota bacterium]